MMDKPRYDLVWGNFKQTIILVVHNRNVLLDDHHGVEAFLRKLAADEKIELVEYANEREYWKDAQA